MALETYPWSATRNAPGQVWAMMVSMKSAPSTPLCKSWSSANAHPWHAYVSRIADQELDARLRVMCTVLIEGPKACGKTANISQGAKTIMHFDEDPVARAQVELDPQALFTGEPPILFDQWQVEPAIWNRMRRQVDD